MAFSLLLPNHLPPRIGQRIDLVVPRRRIATVEARSACWPLQVIELSARVPAHPIAQALLIATQCPIAAPSANKSGHLSPTQAVHVTKDFPDLPTLDGGTCTKGLESTIIGCLEDEPVLLRRGSLNPSELEETLGFQLTYLPENDTQTAQLAPGRLARHYAPRAGLRLDAQTVEPGEALLAFGNDIPFHERHCLNLSPARNLTEAAANLFSFLHELDSRADRIAVMPIPEEGLGTAINDRLRRAPHQNKSNCAFYWSLFSKSARLINPSIIGNILTASDTG